MSGPRREDLPEALRYFRERKGWSQRDLSRRLRDAGHKVTQAMVSQWERGAQMPTVDSLFAVLRCTGATVEDLARAMGSTTTVPRSGPPLLVVRMPEGLEAPPRGPIELEVRLSVVGEQAEDSSEFKFWVAPSGERRG